MARGNILLGQLKGSIGDMTFYRAGGQQVSRARNRQPNNPRTDSQVTSRILLKTVSQAYSALSFNLGNQTFQGAKLGAENQRRFVAANVDLLRQNIDNKDYNFSPKGATQAAANRYIISQGSLADPTVIIDVTSGALNFHVGGNGFSAANSTYAEICAALGLPEGSQLTFAIVQGAGNGYITNVYRQRIVLAPSTGDMNVPFLTNDGEINLPNPANELTVMSVNRQGSGIAFASPIRDCIAVGCVASYYEGSNWKYSNSQLNYIGTGYLTLSEAISSYQVAAARARSSEYTRQAVDTADLADYSGSVTSMLMRVYQYNDGDGFNAARVLRGSLEANGSSNTLTVSEWDESGAYDSVAVEVEYFGTMPRTFNESNVAYDQSYAVDESTAIKSLTYNATKKSYSAVYKVDVARIDGNIGITLNDNNGNQLATASFVLNGAPATLNVSDPNIDGNNLIFTYRGELGFVEGQSVNSESGGKTQTLTAATIQSETVSLLYNVTGGAPFGATMQLGNLVVTIVAGTEDRASTTGPAEITWVINAQ